MKLPAPTVLIICEGFGYTTETNNNMLVQAETPFLDALCENYPTTLLKAHGNALGYPEYYGSSPYAGFWTLISGEKNNTQLAQLDTAITQGTFFEHKLLEKILTPIAKHTRRFHIIATLSYSAPEHRLEHILALIHTALFHEVKEIMIHIVLTDTNTFDTRTFSLLEKLETIVSSVGQVTLASIQGSSYTNIHTAHPSAIEEAYTMLTQPTDISFSSWRDVLSHHYITGVNDNSIPPTALFPDTYIQPKDGVIFATYNKNECHGLKEYLAKTNIPLHPLLSLFHEEHEKTTSLYHQKPLKDIVHHSLITKHISTLAILDYKHKNNLYFYAQDNFKDFTQNFTVRSVLQGLHINTDYTNTITEAFFESLNFEQHSFYIINYHSALEEILNNNLQGALNAIENIDTQLGYIYHEVVEKRKGKLFITSSCPLLEDIPSSSISSRFFNNTNPVFFIAVDPASAHSQTRLPLLELSDVAPFILKHISHSSLK